MRSFIAALIVVFLTAPAMAAPLWLERKFIPTPELVDPIFKSAVETPQQVVNHAPWALFLDRYVGHDEAGVARVAYADVTAEDRTSLDAYIKSLEAIDTARLTRDQQLSYWINLYNAVTVQLILDNSPTKSIRKISKPWDTPLISVKGVQLSLGDIEHGIVRALWPDPRIHYALNCASIGCPNLALVPYTASTLENMLDEAARAYVNDPRGVSFANGKLKVSKIYGWYQEDYGDDDTAILGHIRAYADDNLRAQLEGITKLKRYGYDWDLNAAE